MGWGGLSSELRRVFLDASENCLVHRTPRKLTSCPSDGSAKAQGRAAYLRKANANETHCEADSSLRKLC